MEKIVYYFTRKFLKQETRNVLKIQLGKAKKKISPLYKMKYGTFTSKELKEEITSRINKDFEILMVHSSYDNMLPMYSNSGADRRDDALAYTRDDRFLGRAADQPVDVGPNRDSGDNQELNAVLGDGGDLRRGDDAGIDARLHGVEDVASGEIDRGRLLKVQLDSSFVCTDERIDHALDVAAREVVRFERVRWNLATGLHRRDARIDHCAGRHAAQAHADEFPEADVRAARPCCNPEPDRDQPNEQDE